MGLIQQIPASRSEVSISPRCLHGRRSATTEATSVAPWHSGGPSHPVSSFRKLMKAMIGELENFERRQAIGTPIPCSPCYSGTSRRHRKSLDTHTPP